MKNIFICLILLFTGFLVAGFSNNNQQQTTDVYEKIKARDKIIVGVKYDTKPFGFIDNNQKISGFDIDLAHLIAKYLLNDPNKVEFVQVTPQNRILALNSGQIDMVIATMTVTEQRKQVVEFSRPYYMAGQAIMVNKNSAVSNINDLKNKKIIIVLGTTADRNIKNIAPESLIQGYRTYNDAFAALKNNRGDALITDDSILLGLVANDKDFKILSKRYTKEPYAIALKKGPEAHKLLFHIDSALNAYEQSGELKKLKQKWIKN